MTNENISQEELNRVHSLKQNDLSRNQFCLCAAKFSENKDGCIVEIEDNPFIFINNHHRKLISDPNGTFAKAGYCRWAAGGSLIVINQDGKKSAVAIVRDSKAPTYRNHATLTSGLSNSHSNWINPTEICIREGFEEIAILLNKTLVTATFKQTSFEQALWKIFKFQEERLAKMDIDFKRGQAIHANTQELENFSKDIVIVKQGQRQAASKGIIVQDKNTNGIDLIKIIEIDLPPGEISIIDCEDFNGNILDREILLFDLANTKLQEPKQQGSAATILGDFQTFRAGICEPVSGKQYSIVPVLYEALKTFL